MAMCLMHQLNLLGKCSACIWVINTDLPRAVSISIPQQAFLDASSAQNPTLSYGADGILGLGFTSLSTIDALVNMTNSSNGRSLLYNLFLDNPKEPNFIAFSLQRSSDQNDTADGSFSVGQFSELSDVTKRSFDIVSAQVNMTHNTRVLPIPPRFLRFRRLHPNDGVFLWIPLSLGRIRSP
jgi:hypothetical protein